MFSTKSAQSLRNLFAGYHEPAGLSKQQSQKLLDGLKTSFRQQLDLEYGRGSERRATSAPAPAPAARGPDADSRLRHSAATQHLKSILSNPLFSYRKQAGPMPPSISPDAKRDPMDVFDHAVAKGMMNLKAATGCIMAKRQMLSRHRESPPASSETALRVLRWLKSSGAEADPRFLDDHAFVRALTPVLVAEGLQDAAWEWISRTLTATNVSWDKELRVRRASFLLAQMVRAKSQPQHGGGGNLDAAMTTILDAERLFRDQALLPRLLFSPWRSVSWLSTVESYMRAAPSEKTFDAHVAVAQVLGRDLDVETAHLHLRHPTHPDHMPAMRFLNDREKLHRLVRRPGPEKPRVATARGMSVLPWLAFLGHDIVSHLLQLGRRQEADSVTELLRAELADFSHETPSLA